MNLGGRREHRDQQKTNNRRSQTAAIIILSISCHFATRHLHDARDRKAEYGLREPVGGSMFLGMKFVTSITRDEDGMWIVECPAIPGCVSQGKTRAEALENAREAIAACLEVRAERGMPLTVETEELEVVA